MERGPTAIRHSNHRLRSDGSASSTLPDCLKLRKLFVTAASAYFAQPSKARAHVCDAASAKGVNKLIFVFGLDQQPDCAGRTSG